MTYAQFLLVFLVLPIIAIMVGMLWAKKNVGLATIDLRYHWHGVLILAAIAFVWTTPWDNYLIARGVWDSPPDRVLGRIFYVPVEEYAFFVLMPILNGAVVVWFHKFQPKSTSTWRDSQKIERVAAACLAALLFCGGLYALRHESGTYLGLTLVWFTPPLLIQWMFDPRALWRGRWVVFAGTLIPSLYFGAADYFAISQGIWMISESRTTGLGLSQLPFEEVMFFAVTSLLLVQGIVLWHSIKKSPALK